MNRRRLLLALALVNLTVAVAADNAWSRMAGLFIALGCLFAYLNARSRKGVPAPADMPVGTVIELDGMTAKKTRRSDRDPQPWTSMGVAYTDEWAAGVIAGGAQARQPRASRG